VLQRFTMSATRYYPYRWRYVAASVLVVLVLLIVFSVFPRAAMVATLVAGPVLALSWGMAMLCFWFEPVRGSLFSSIFLRRIPRIGQLVVQWYAAVFLMIWLIFGVVVWPLFILLM
jgi:hypothetical protein